MSLDTTTQEEHFPYYARLRERVRFISAPALPQNTTVEVVDRVETSPDYRYIVTEAGHKHTLRVTTLQRLCAVCEEADAVAPGVYHPHTWLCAACLTVEPAPQAPALVECPACGETSYNVAVQTCRTPLCAFGGQERPQTRPEVPRALEGHPDWFLEEA